MKQLECPFMNMSKPHLEDYQKRTSEICLFSYYEQFNEDRYDDGLDEEDIAHRQMYHVNGPMDGKSSWYSGYRDQPPIPKLNVKDVTLQTLLDLLPPGVTADQVYMKSYIDAGAYGVHGHEVCFYYKIELPDELEQYEKDMTVWQALYSEYESKLKEYEAAQKEQEVQRLEEQLNRLKR